MANKISADYVIIGSGAVGMAFADVLLTESDATVIIIDRYAKPGGHWNVAYPFVQLHQPSAFYGVSSKELSGGRIEQGGLNDGLGELASGAEVSAYFDDVMRHQFLPTGRVQYFPMCDYQGDGKFVSKVSGEVYRATATRKIVDATHLKTSVPSTHTPNFEIADGAAFMPLNDLPTLTNAPDEYVIIGSGKTGIDACLWLLTNGVDPDKITWIMPSDAWFLDRKTTQVLPEFYFDTLGTFAAQMEAVAGAASIEDMFDRLEDCGYFVRLDPNVRPSVFRGATVSMAELTELRRIRNVVRKGRVKSIRANEIELDEGKIDTHTNALHVDCSARAIGNLDPKPIFQGDVITPQLVRPYQPVFSAAFIAHVELAYEDEADKKRLCGVVALPDRDTDYIRFTAAALMNQSQWAQDKPLQKWISANRLDGISTLVSAVDTSDTDKQAVITRLRKHAPMAAMKLMQFIQQLD